MGLLLLRPCSKLMLPSPLRRGTRRFFLRGGSSTPAIRCHKFPASEVTSLEREALWGFFSEKMKATEVAHSIWKSVLRKGDCAIDATCGNGHDTLFILRLVADDSGNGLVYGFDVQTSALEITLSLLAESVDDPRVRERVKLSLLCHSRMEDVVPKDAAVRLVAFNLGYLPAGDREIITVPQTTLPALEAASRIVASGGLISVLVYVGHPGGRDEYETVQAFASSLPSESWSCCKLERLNRPTAPVLVLLFKK